MQKRWLCLAWFCIGSAVAQVPSPDDPLWQYPALTGVNAPVKASCDMRVTVPGEKFCLQPTPKAGLWVSADDIIRSGNVADWPAQRGLLEQKDLFLRPSMALNRFNGWPAVKFERDAEMETGAAADFGIRRFTLFIVGRKIPGADYGGIFGHEDHPDWGALYWAGANGLILNVQSANPVMWQYDSVEEFHLIALRCDFATVSAYLNGVPLETRTLAASKPGYPVNRGVAFTHVGRVGHAPPRDTQARMNAPRGPVRGSEIAELITYGHTLTDEEFAATTRYLIRKYGLPIPGRETEAAEDEPARPAEIFEFAAANDPAEQALTQHPVMLGFNSPTAKQCSFTAHAGEPGWCLRAADGMQAWLRSDDVWTRTTQLKLWKSPPSISNEATAGEDPANSAWLMPNALAGFPIVRVAERASLRLKTPVVAREFTVFIVGRQTPGSAMGNILSADPAHEQGISWRGGNVLQLRGAADSGLDFDDPLAGEFHIAALTYRDGTAVAYSGDGPGQPGEIDLSAGMRFNCVGVPSRSAPLGDGAPRSPFAGLQQLRAPANPSSGADIAELIVWPRALERDDMAVTLRYLRKKYSLP